MNRTKLQKFHAACCVFTRIRRQWRNPEGKPKEVENDPVCLLAQILSKRHTRWHDGSGVPSEVGGGFPPHGWQNFVKFAINLYPTFLFQVEQEVAIQIEEWEKQTGQIFLVGGVRFLDFIKSQWENYRLQKENEKRQRVSVWRAPFWWKVCTFQEVYAVADISALNIQIAVHLSDETAVSNVWAFISDTGEGKEKPNENGIQVWQQACHSRKARLSQWDHAK